MKALMAIVAAFAISQTAFALPQQNFTVRKDRITTGGFATVEFPEGGGSLIAVPMTEAIADQVLALPDGVFACVGKVFYAQIFELASCTPSK